MGYNNRVRWRLILLLVMCWSPTVHAQSTALGDISNYNVLDASILLDLDESDLRFNQIDPSGGIVSLSVGEITHLAYLIPVELDTGNLESAARLLGFHPTSDGIEFALVVSRTASTISYLKRHRNPMTPFLAQLGDTVRVDAIAGLPRSEQTQLQTTVTQTLERGDLELALSPAEADAQGIFVGRDGNITLNGQVRSFIRVEQDRYFQSAVRDIYLMEVDGDLRLLPPPDQRDALDLGFAFGMAEGQEIRFEFPIFFPQEDIAGYITDIQENGTQLITTIPEARLDDLGIPLGGYAVFILNGQLRAAMVMDENMIVNAFERFGLSSNYILLRQLGALKLIYMTPDGRNAQDIFEAQIGDPIRLRPAQAVETIIRAEAIVKVIAEIDPEGFLYSDVTPFELSFLEVLVGEFVNVNINGIDYRAKVVDDTLVNIPDPTTPIFLYPFSERIIVTHQAEDQITAEGRFQAGVGNVIVISRAPN